MSARAKRLATRVGLPVVLVIGVPGMLLARSDVTAVEQDHFRRVPVVVVVFDELPVASLMDRTGQIDQALFPNFARLAHDATWFRNTTSVAAFTRDALPALLTGRYPDHGFRLWRRGFTDNLFTLLGDAYEIRTAEQLSDFCPVTICRRRVRSQALPGTHAFGSGARGTDAASFLALIERSTRPRLYFAHLVMPHSSWRYLPDGRRYWENEPMPGETDPPGPGRGWGFDPWIAAQAFQRHLLQTRLTDRVLGLILDRLQSEKLYRRALVVVVADQGLGFVPGAAKRVITARTMGHVAPVPLFVKRPFQTQGRISDAPVQTTDLVPTIADVLDLSTKWDDVDGISAFARDIPRDRARYIEGQPIPSDERGKDELIAWKYELFGRSNGRIDLWALAPKGYRALVGRKAPLTPQPERYGPIVKIRRPRALAAAAATDDVLPVLVEGEILDGGRAVPAVAIAIDGRIAAVGGTYFERGTVRFTAMVPPEAFGRAPNDVDVLLVARGRLIPTRLLAYRS